MTPRTAWLCRFILVGWAALGLVAIAHAHQVMGKASASYLYGHKIGSPATSEPVNCCKYAAGGDCREVSAGAIKPVSLGYEIEGEFIAATEITVSPTDADGEARAWICRGKGKPAHCAFLPAQGT